MSAPSLPGPYGALPRSTTGTSLAQAAPSSRPVLSTRGWPWLGLSPSPPATRTPSAWLRCRR
eukprot:12371730-Alexandrium_andersonii.AAC.1